MNILWVEDNPENKKEFWFGNRNVTTVTDFSEAKEIIQTKLNNYDVVVLDINLDKSENNKKVELLAKEFDLSVDAFLTKSGMHLFLLLLEQSFPRKQITFLTGNADKPNQLAELIKIIELSANTDEKKSAIDKIHRILSDPQWKELQLQNDKDSRVIYLKNLITSKAIENTFDIFCRAYKGACILPPEENPISRSIESEAQKELTDWLKKHESNDYLILRRGIIEGCKALKELIEKNDDNIQIRRFVKGASKNNPTIQILKTDIENYLDTLAQFLPVRKPDAINEEYRLFLRTLVHEWELNINPEEIIYKITNRLASRNRVSLLEIERIKATDEYKCEYEKIHDIHTFAWLSKQTRNWVSHAKLLEPLDSEIIAFLFLVNMRAIFKYPVEVQNYEYILLKCISKQSDCFVDNDELDNHINLLNIRIDEILDSLSIPSDIEFKDNSGRRRKYFSEKINDIYLKNTGTTRNHDYQAFLFQLFFVNQQDYLENLTANSDDFLPTLARHIYNRSFS
jgi:CheY-like chemotaxis protein